MSLVQYIFPDNDDDKRLSSHLYKAVMSEYVEGQITAGQARTAFEEHLGATLDASAINQLLILSGLIDAEPTRAEKRHKLDEIYRIFVIAEHRISLYSTVGSVVTRLGL